GDLQLTGSAGPSTPPDHGHGGSADTGGGGQDQYLRAGYQAASLLGLRHGERKHVAVRVPVAIDVVPRPGGKRSIPPMRSSPWSPKRREGRWQNTTSRSRAPQPVRSITLK